MRTRTDRAWIGTLIVFALLSSAACASEDAMPLLDRLRDLRVRLNRPLRVNEMESESKGILHSTPEWMAAWKWLKDGQSGGLIKLADLANFASARRELLRSVELSYQVRVFEGERGGARRLCFCE